MATNLTKPVSRKSAVAPFNYGPDRGRRIVVTIFPGGAQPDRIELRLERLRNGIGMNLDDLYKTLVLMKANNARMAILREKKVKKEAAKRDQQWKREVRKEIEQS